jgi:hypothetical protein
MSREHLELAGAAVIALAVVITVGMVTWSLLRPSQVLARLVAPDDWELRASALPDPDDWPEADETPRWIRNQVTEMPPEPPVVASSTPAPPWSPRPPYGVSDRKREPVRIAFCVFLLGGPNYYRPGG